MDSPPPSPTSEDSLKKNKENSFVLKELDFLTPISPRHVSPPSLFELLPDFLEVGDDEKSSYCLADDEQDYSYWGFNKLVSDQQEPLPPLPFQEEPPSCTSDEDAGNIQHHYIQQHSTVTEACQEQSVTRSVESTPNSFRNVGSANFVGNSPEDSISTSVLSQVSEDYYSVTTSFHDNNKLQPAISPRNGNEEFDQSMLFRNSTPATIASDSYSYRRQCACKKTHCLKGYCSCFGDGFKCTDYCTCLDCYNRPEHQVKIDNAKQKQKVISRIKPIAYASETHNHSATNIPLKNKEKDVNPNYNREDYGEKLLLPSDLQHIMHHVSHPTTPKLQDFGMSQLAPEYVTRPFPLTNPASMSGASRNWRHNSNGNLDWRHSSNGNSVFGDRLVIPQSSTTPTTIMTRHNTYIYRSQELFESSNPVSFAFDTEQNATNTEQNATNTSSNIMEENSNSKRLCRRIPIQKGLSNIGQILIHSDANIAHQCFR